MKIFTPILILLTVFVLIAGSKVTSDQPKNSLEDLVFDHNPVSQFAIKRSAMVNDINKEDVPFLCPEPKESGVNECLMYQYQKYYGKGFYQGGKSKEYNKLLINYAEGKINSDRVIQEINNLTSWVEVGKGIGREKEKKQQVIVTNVMVETFETESNLANEIWGGIANRNLLLDSDYYEALIYFDEKTEKNNVSILGVDLAYIEESWD